MGTQDSLELAQDFMSDYDMAAFPMLWDPGFESWAAFGVRGQPNAVLMNSAGHAKKGWPGRLPESEVLELARTLG